MTEIRELINPRKVLTKMGKKRGETAYTLLLTTPWPLIAQKSAAVHYGRRQAVDQRWHHWYLLRSLEMKYKYYIFMMTSMENVCWWRFGAGLLCTEFKVTERPRHGLTPTSCIAHDDDEQFLTDEVRHMFPWEINESRVWVRENLERTWRSELQRRKEACVWRNLELKLD